MNDFQTTLKASLVRYIGDVGQRPTVAELASATRQKYDDVARQIHFMQLQGQVSIDPAPYAQRITPIFPRIAASSCGKGPL